MGCVNSTVNVRQAQDYELGSVRNDQSAQASTSRTVLRQDIDPRLASLSRAPSGTSLREGDRYNTIGMTKEKFDADQMANAESPNWIPYLSAGQRARYKVSIDHGALYQKGDSGNHVPMDTQGVDHMFVMDGKGNIYAGDQLDVKHHSSFLAGAPVAAAGTMEVESGRLRYVTDQSGHYAPTTDHTAQLFAELERRRADLTNVQTQYTGLSKQQLASQNVQFERVYPEGVRKKPY